MRRALLDRDLEDTDMIFAQGRDAGFLHSRGEENAGIVSGLPIVFDLFPREFGGDFFHDVARTWSPGYARPDVQATFDQGLAAKLAERLGGPCYTLGQMRAETLLETVRGEMDYK